MRRKSVFAGISSLFWGKRGGKLMHGAHLTRNVSGLRLGEMLRCEDHLVRMRRSISLGVLETISAGKRIPAASGAEGNVNGD